MKIKNPKTWEEVLNNVSWECGFCGHPKGTHHSKKGYCRRKNCKCPKCILRTTEESTNEANKRWEEIKNNFTAKK